MRTDLLDRPLDGGFGPSPIRIAHRAVQDQELARRLKAVRHSLGASLDEVASLAGLPPSRLQSYELGVSIPQPRTLARICGALGVSATPLLRLRRHALASAHPMPLGREQP